MFVLKSVRQECFMVALFFFMVIIIDWGLLCIHTRTDNRTDKDGNFVHFILLKWTGAAAKGAALSVHTVSVVLY